MGSVNIDCMFVKKDLCGWWMDDNVLLISPPGQLQLFVEVRSFKFDTSEEFIWLLRKTGANSINQFYIHLNEIQYRDVTALLIFFKKKIWGSWRWTFIHLSKFQIDLFSFRFTNTSALNRTRTICPSWRMNCFANLLFFINENCCTRIMRT